MSNPDDQGIGYWLQWQVPICAFIIVAPGVAAACIIKKVRAEETLYYNDLWKPCWRCLNPLYLLLFRAFALVCLAPVLVGVASIDGISTYYFYTQWTFTLVMVYFALATIMSAYGCYWESRNQSASGAGNAEASLFLETGLDENDKGKGMKGADDGRVQLKAGFVGYLMLTIYQICGGAVILTDIVFWCLLLPFQSDEHFHLNMLMGCIHSLNVVFLVLDTALNNLPFHWFRFVYFVLWSCLYMVFQWVLHASGVSGWPYEFLELNTPWAPLWYFAMAVVHVPCYGMYVLLVKAKYSLLPKWFPNAFVRSSYS